MTTITDYYWADDVDSISFNKMKSYRSLMIAVIFGYLPVRCSRQLVISLHHFSYARSNQGLKASLMSHYPVAIAHRSHWVLRCQSNWNWWDLEKHELTIQLIKIHFNGTSTLQSISASITTMKGWWSIWIIEPKM